MELRTGIDIIEVERIKDAINKQGENFLNRVYTKKEIEYCKNKGKISFQHYAARFAAKEAVYKAISSEIPQNTDNIFNKIEILNKEDGKPYVNIENLNIANIKNIDISLSHIKEFAVASVVVVFNVS